MIFAFSLLRLHYELLHHISLPFRECISLSSDTNLKFEAMYLSDTVTSFQFIAL